MLFDVLDRFITNTLKFIPITEDAYLHFEALRIYANVVPMLWHTMSPRSLEGVVNLMFDHYNGETYVSRKVARIIAEGLCKGNPATYSVFRTARGLEHFRHHGYRSWVVDIIKGYISPFGHSSKSCPDPLVEQEYIGYLHEPDNLFVVYSILTVGNSDFIDEYRKMQIKWNILSQVRIQRDAPVWDECRCRLQRLLEEDDMGFFY
ncbi:hypothetical protein DFS33DRAFT_342904 [Desarmillaria ectypa]|nr:hypothetical protein DFS33DRAFT_342904 [Desarmillaria ectypa]